MSLLHLAASLGYSRLVSTLLLWRSEYTNTVLDTEIDALSQDNEGFTPLVCGIGSSICLSLENNFLPLSRIKLKLKYSLEYLL